MPEIAIKRRSELNLFWNLSYKGSNQRELDLGISEENY